MSLLESVMANSVYHYSEGDTLYLPVSEKTNALVKDYAHPTNVRSFWCNKSYMYWYEVRFANDRYWEEKIQKLSENPGFPL